MPTSSQPLEEEIAYFKENLPQWLTRHRGRVALVKGNQLVGVYDNEREALSAGVSSFGLGPYLIRRIAEPSPIAGILAYELGLLNAANIKPL